MVNRSTKRWPDCRATASAYWRSVMTRSSMSRRPSSGPSPSSPISPVTSDARTAPVRTSVWTTPRMAMSSPHVGTAGRTGPGRVPRRFGTPRSSNASDASAGQAQDQRIFPQAECEDAAADEAGGIFGRMTFLAADPPTALRRVRDRAVLLNQILVGTGVVLATFLSLATGTVAAVDPLMLGLLLVFVATGMAILVPWESGPVGLVLLLPLIDIGAITLLTLSAPGSGFPLLWLFPAMWIGSSLGTLGVIGATVLVTAVYWATIIYSGETFEMSAFVVYPVVVAGLATIASVASWRSTAQRVVLDKQSRELRRAVDRARGQEELVTEVLDAVDFGVVRLTADGEQVVSNEAMARLQLAIDDTDLLQPFASDGLTPLAEADLPLSRARRGEELERALVWFGAPGDAARRALRFNSRRVAGKSAVDDGVILVAQDTTSEELALRAREDLIASVSHELRTPLTSITGYVELVLDDETLSESSRRSLGVVERNAARLLAIVSDLVAASAMSRMGVSITLHPEPIDLTALAASSIESALLPAAERGISIELLADGPIMVNADPHRIRQVIDNLISNAVKYGRVRGRVDVEVRRHDDRITLTVADDGPGIPPGEVPRLFERFFRSALVRQSVTHGSGLGLSISRDIVLAHDGRLTVRTALGEGSEFTMSLPVLPPREES
ncbi:sensor histidine kinase [Microbacterium esteraromaticum]|nr:sensor histidine kinase [Microbacterium esteraromaticum]